MSNTITHYGARRVWSTTFRASITMKKNIWLNKACSECCFSGYDMVELEINSDKSKILIYPFIKTGWIDDQNVAFIRDIEDNGAIINAAVIINLLTPIRAVFGQYEPAWNTEEGVLAIDLDRKCRAY